VTDYRTPSYAAEEFDYYFFEKNLQGDIIAIYNESGTKIGTYTYDAWGNCTITSNTSGYNFILSNNPFRYRGYYYDTETGFYYLQSRYYNPEVVGLESDRRRGRMKGGRQGRKQGVSEASPALRTETTMFSSGPFKSHLLGQ
jgi:hypothetical protein